MVLPRGAVRTAPMLETRRGDGGRWRPARRNGTRFFQAALVRSLNIARQVSDFTSKGAQFTVAKGSSRRLEP